MLKVTIDGFSDVSGLVGSVLDFQATFANPHTCSVKPKQDYLQFVGPPAPSQRCCRSSGGRWPLRALSMWSESTFKKKKKKTKSSATGQCAHICGRRRTNPFMKGELLGGAYMVSALLFSCKFWWCNNSYVAGLAEGLVLRLVIKKAVDHLVVNLLFMSVLA